MTTKSEQVKSLIKFLEDPKREEQTVEEVASDIVDAFYDLLTKGLKEVRPTLKVGEPFKHAVTNKVHYIAWTDESLYWVVTGDSRYGYLGSIEPWQAYASESKAKSGAPGTNAKGWKVGDRVSFRQGSVNAEIIAVCDKCVLMMPDGDTRPIVEPNDSMEKFYKKTVSKVKLF